ncbi:hypothetical protein BKA65DRAFT_552339 [Rhexocercosporidium sp. MPI-PUGE-AT-0058]|nr:hypothetical protein BKA65DRAFT_552339 [Rhexocercosporidium sp. MPI-PUGE-AT-0058]
MSDDELDLEDLFGVEDIEDTKNHQDDHSRSLIDKIKKTFARHPTAFELLALSILPLSDDEHHRYHRNQQGFKIKCCKKAFQILLNCHHNDDVTRLHEAGSLLHVVNEGPSPVRGYFAMPSPPLFVQYNQPNSPYEGLSIPNDTFGDVLSTNEAGSRIHLPSAATYNRRHNVADNLARSSSVQYPNHYPSGARTNLFAAITHTPSTSRVSGDLPRPNYASSFGAANHTSPSPGPGKRAFSSTYPSSNTMTTSELNYSPSPKRRGSLFGSEDRLTIGSTGYEPINSPATLNRDTSQLRARQITGYASDQPATQQGFQHEKAENGTSKPAGLGDTQRFGKYYRYLAEKNNLKSDQIALREEAPPRPYVSPYTPAPVPRSNSEQQGSRSISNPARTPPIITLAAVSGLQGMNPSLADQHQGPPQQLVAPNEKTLDGRVDVHKRQSAEEHQNKIRMQYLEIMKQRQADGGWNNGQAFSYAYAMNQPGLAVPLGSNKSVNSNPFGPPRQAVPSNVHPPTLRSASTPQYPYAENSNLELSQQLEEEHALKSHLLPPPSFSTGTSGYAAAKNVPLSASSVPGPQTGGSWYQRSRQNSFLSRPGEIGAAPPYSPTRTEPIASVDLFTNGPSLPPLSAHYAGQHDDNNPNPTRLSTIPQNLIDVAAELDPMFSSKKVPLEYREDYVKFLAGLVTGVHGDCQNIPPYLVIRAKVKAGLLVASEPSDSEDDSEDEVRPKPPPYQRIEATALTGPLPNINQQYTGSPGSMPPWVKHIYPDYPGEAPPMPGKTPTKKRSTSKKTAPTSKSKKTPTPRKSRAKKTSQSNEQPTNPRTLSPRPPPAYDLSILVHENRMSSSTLENMKAGNYAEFFESAEEETKWKQGAVAQVLAEKGTPSKYQLKKDEQERKRLEKELKAKK